MFKNLLLAIILLTATFTSISYAKETASITSLSYAQAACDAPAPKTAYDKTLEVLGLKANMPAVTNCAFPLGATCCKKDYGGTTCFQYCTRLMCPIGWTQV